MAPIYAAAASILILHLHLILVSRPLLKLLSKNTSELDVVYDETLVLDTGSSTIAKFRKHVHKLGGYTTFAFKLAQLLSCLTLVTLSAFTHYESKWLQIGLLATYVCILYLIFVCQIYARTGILEYSRLRLIDISTAAFIIGDETSSSRLTSRLDDVYLSRCVAPGNVYP